jgi:hypothetical protein
VTVIWTFGDHGRLHPHLHLLVADGLFLPNRSCSVLIRVPWFAMLY